MNHMSNDATQLHCNATSDSSAAATACHDDVVVAAAVVDALLLHKSDADSAAISSQSPASAALNDSDAQATGVIATASKATITSMTTTNASKKKALKKTKKKHVRWSTITVHEFGIGLGGGAVPSKGGPSIGLADTPEFTWVTKVGEMAERSEGIHRFTSQQRTRLLQRAGIADAMIERYARETSIILDSRRRMFLEDLADERKEKSRKRNAEQALMERPCSVYLRRPSMIPTNYV
uniref:Uncharacterized protein n=1 Tax=Globisporangium ultimum (strain ATCC 200006 / CBS 805.95 / DAOM BR144) TaxID=431595 RepID=K3WBU2_GLOUD